MLRFSNVSSFTLLLIFSVLSCSPEQADNNDAVSQNGTTEGTIKFTELDESQTNIAFNNGLRESRNLNIFIWNFMYSGAGVAAGDLNNDGLPDLYFAGNAAQDKIYINKGNFKFEDITAQSGIDPRQWTTGVTMADINGDGYLDIYVCKNSPTAIPEKNLNKLYINNKNGTFTEQGAKFGLDDTGFSIQATFFDADNDGDLDVYLINQPFDEFARLLNDPALVATYPSSDRMLFFENGRFVDKTNALQLKNERYGLNVSLGDFNLDGWGDLYVSNDYHHADHLYMNKGGTFGDEIHQKMGHISFFSMGTDVADINNDGLLDVMTLDMAFSDHLRSKTNMESMDTKRFWDLVEDKQHYQYAQNNLHVNQGNKGFTEIAQVAGLAKTDWSWSPLFVDLDNNGWKDLLVTNGIMRDLKNNDFNQFIQQNFGGRVGPQNFEQVMSKMPSNPIANLAYRNKGNYQFEDISSTSGFSFKGASHGMAYADFDQDGLIDVVVNNMNAPAGIYKNVSTNSGNYLTVALTGPPPNTHGLGASVIAYSNGQKQVACMQTTRGYLSASEPVVHFGFGNLKQIDSLEIIWNNQFMTRMNKVKTNQHLKVNYRTASKVPFKKSRTSDWQLEEKKSFAFEHKETIFDDYKEQVLLPYKLSQNGPFLAKGDVNGDGLEDVFIGGALNQSGQIFNQNQDGTFSKSTQSAFDKNKGAEDMQAVFFDADGDSDLDLVVTSGSNELADENSLLRIRCYTNNGKGLFTESSQKILPDQVNSQCVVHFDADGDGDQDLFVGGRLVAGKYPASANSKLWINESGQWIDKTKELAPFFEELGMVTDAVAADVDGDNDDDLLVVGEWMTPHLIINNKEKGFESKVLTDIGTGLWWTIQQGDFDQDGDPDFLLGNLGWNNKFGGAKKANLEIYGEDFDKNGDHDIVLATTKGSKTLPVRGRECSSQEMAFVLDKFPSYQSFGQAEINDLLSENQRNNSIHKKLNTFTSIYLSNDGNGQFTKSSLPIECQFGPVKSFAVDDINEDGNLDFIYGGNHFPVEVETARYDGLGLGLCLGNGKGGFTHQSMDFTETEAISDVRDIKILKLQNERKLILVANNNGPLKSYLISN